MYNFMRTLLFIATCPEDITSRRMGDLTEVSFTSSSAGRLRRIRSRASEIVEQHGMYLHTERDCSVPEGTTVGTYRLDKCIGSGFDGEVWKGFGTNDDKPLVLKLLHSRRTKELEEMAENECQFAKIAYEHMPDHFINCFGVFTETIGVQDRVVTVLELADGQDVPEWLTEAADKVPEPLPDLCSVFEFTNGLRNTVEFAGPQKGFGLVQYRHQDAHLANVMMAADGSWKLIDYGRTRICCDEIDLSDPQCTGVARCVEEFFPVLGTSVVWFFLNWAAIVGTGMPFVPFSESNKWLLDLVIRPLRGGEVNRNITVAQAVAGWPIREAYQHDFSLVNAESILEMVFVMALTDFSTPEGQAKMNDLLQAMKAESEEALATLRNENRCLRATSDVD